MPLINCPAAGCEVTFRDDLDATVLAQLIGIHATTAHPTPAANPNDTAAHSRQVRRPTISKDISTEDFEYFLLRWGEYKIATHIQNQDIITQLLECTEEDLRKDLNRAYGTLTNNTEEDALHKIKSLAVKMENILVSRLQLHNLKQDRDETVRAFAARLRGQAKVCEFLKTKKCTCENEVQIDYSDEIIRDTLIRGLSDEDIQLHILGQRNQQLTLDETMALAEAQESGKRSVGIISNPVISTNAASTYKKSKPVSQNKPLMQNTENQRKKCTFCGGPTFHGLRKLERKKKCPAYNHQCTKCGIYNHYEQVCQSQNIKKPIKNSNTNVAEDNYSSEFNDALFDDVMDGSSSLI